MNIIFSLPPAHKPTFCSIDTEWFKMEKGKMHRPITGIFACMQICYDGEDVYMLTKPEDVAPALEILKDDVWTFADAKFDLTHLRRYATIPPRKKLWDVFLIEKIMYSGYYDYFGLKPLVRRYLQIELEKESRELFENAEELTEEMVQYAAMDAWATYHVRQEQAKVITNNDLNRIWHIVDRPALFAVMDMPGFRIDVDKWNALDDKNRVIYDELCASMPYKPLSHKKIKEHLKQLGWKTLKDTQEKTLVQQINKHPDSAAAKQAQLILDARGFGKLISTYGRKMIEDHGEWRDGMCFILSDYAIIGAETGRTASSDPNLQNIPTRDTKEYRDCFIARPGNVLIILDYSAQEPRITAYLSGDKKLIKIFKDGKDVYIEMARIIFNKTITKHDPLRKKMKGVILGMSYGLTEYGLAIRENISVDEAAELLDAGWKALPQSKAYMDRQRSKKGYVTTVMGRKFYINPYNEQHERNGLNAPVQGTGGDQFKMAIGVGFHQNWNYEKWGQFGLVNLVHDETVLDVPKEHATEIAEFAKRTMIKVAEDMCPGLPFDVDVHIGNTWAEKE